MKTYIKPQIRVTETDSVEILAQSLEIKNDPNPDIVISEPEDVLTKKSLWDMNW